MTDPKTPILIPERNKKPGVFYAVTHSGLEVPVIDVTHPAFHLEPTRAQLDVLNEQYLHTTGQTNRMPAFLRRLFFAFLRRRSMLVDGLMRAQGGHLDGTTTYIMKLGPENLGAGYATAIDRRFASGLPPFLARWRVQQIAGFLADGLEPTLMSHPSLPLLLLNIAGGTAVDSLNALLILKRRSPRLLEGRKVTLCILDLDDKGPTFGARALETLQADGAPLHGLDITFNYVYYDWTDCATLEKTLVGRQDHPTLLAVSSEGGLFEYGDDITVLKNLRVLREHSSPDTVVAGSVMLETKFFRRTLRSLGLTTVPRTHEGFRALVGKAGWTVTALSETPASFNVCLRPTG